MQRLPRRCRRRAQRGLEGGERQLVDPERPGQRGAAAPLHEFGVAGDDACLWTAEQLVAARGHQARAAPQGRGEVRLVGKQGVGLQQATSHVDDDRWPEAGELVHIHVRREPGDPEVGRVHLQDAPGVRADGVGIVAQRRAVGGADLAQPRAGGDEEVGQPETVTDLDQLAAADDDLAAGREHAHGEQECRRAVVHDRDVVRVRDCLSERFERAATAPGPGSGCQVELDVDRAGAAHNRVDGRRRQRSAAEVGVQHDAGRVQHLAQGRGRRR